MNRKAAVHVQKRKWRAARWHTQLLAFFTLIGLAASGYLAYTSLVSGALYCAGIGNCETVHASAYSQIYGVPIAYLGFGSYVAIGGLLLWQAMATEASRKYLASLGILAVAISGVIFSAYLTYVELFVILAICPWCVVSALAMLALAFTSGAAVRSALR